MQDIKNVTSAGARTDVADGDMEKVPVSQYELELERALQAYVPGSDEEKRLVRKLDMYMMPTLWIMYILAYIDRQNIVSSSSSSSSF